MKGAEFSVHGIQNSRQGYQTLPTNGNLAVLTQWWLACWLLGLITTYTESGCEMNEWGEEDSEEREEMDGGSEKQRKWLKREQLVQIKSGDWCVSFALQLSICFVCFVYSILSKLIMGCDAQQISEKSYNKMSHFIQRTCSHLLMGAAVKKCHFNFSVTGLGI